MNRLTDDELISQMTYSFDSLNEERLKFEREKDNCPLDKTSPLRRFAQKRREDNSFLFIYGHYSMNVEFSTK